MVALVIGQMHLEQLQILIDVLHQAQALYHQVHRADATAVHRSRSLRHLVVDIAGLEHRLRLLLPVLGLESALDSLLAIAQDFAIGSIHSKWPFVGCFVCCGKRISTNIYRHFELFISPAASMRWTRA